MLFAFEHAGIEPDIIVMSKAVGVAGPLAVLGIKSSSMRAPGHYTGTFRGNQLAMATKSDNAEILKDDKIADKVAARMRAEGKLADLQKRYPVIGRTWSGSDDRIVKLLPNEAQDHMGCYPADGELSALPQKNASKRADSGAWRP